MLRSLTKPLSGWGRYPVETGAGYRPEKRADLAPLVREAPERDLISRGLGRSYGDAAINDGGVVFHERLDRMLSFDPQTAVLEAEAGVTFADILAAFVPRGFFLPVTPGTKFVTLGGAIAANVHGKNHHKDGALAAFIESFELLTADGQTLTCSREQNADVFWATLGGMGLTGIIVTARLRLTRIDSAYIAVDYQKATNLDQALELFAGGDQKYQYSVAWIDCLASGASLGRSVLIRGNHAALADLSTSRMAAPLIMEPARTKSVPFNFPGFALNPLSVKLFNARFYNKHEDGRQVIDYDEFFYPLDSVLNWNRIYGKRGFVQYQAAFPPETSRAGLVALLETLSASKRASFLAVLKTFGPSDDGLLSFPMPGQTLALDLPFTGERLLQLMHQLDAIVLKHGGRVYLAKDACLERPSLAAMYPKLEQFKQIKARLDPQNRFASSLSKRLGITGGA